MWFEVVEVEGCCCCCCCEVVVAVLDFGSLVVSDSVDESRSLVLAFEHDFDDFDDF